MSVQYRPTDDERHAAYAVARRRHTLNGGQASLGRFTDQERLRAHYGSALAEISVSRLTNLAWTGCGKGAGGALRDVGGLLEVRSTLVRGRGLRVEPNDDSDLPAVAVHVDVETGTCSALGWEVVENVRGRGTRRPSKTPGACYWTLDPHELVPIEELFRLLRRRGT